ncbi:MAG: transcriptional repressor [Thermodesulfovibrionales bacterium]|jgi:Fur family ferric uptake transcriptional regulator|nr:transcriptional repressor [Thermodesulfovibrionales bacterium]
MEKQKFREFLTTKGLKLTKERDEILNEILAMKKHFDPEELFIRLKTKGSKVSRASVYRTIPLLIEIGLIEEVERIDRHAHYEKVSKDRHHDHMICMKCGKVIEFYSPTLEMLQDEICQKEKFRGIRHSLEILGYCEKCG